MELYFQEHDVDPDAESMPQAPREPTRADMPAMSATETAMANMLSMLDRSRPARADWETESLSNLNPSQAWSDARADVFPLAASMPRPPSEWAAMPVMSAAEAAIAYMQSTDAQSRAVRAQMANWDEQVLSSFFATQTGSNTRAEGLPPAASSVIEQLPHIAVGDRVSGSDGQHECTICTDKFCTGGFVTRLPCGHEFHRECVSAWLRRHCSCPVCRAEMLSNDPAYEAHKRSRKRADAIVDMQRAMLN